MNGILFLIFHFYSSDSFWSSYSTSYSFSGFLLKYFMSLLHHLSHDKKNVLIYGSGEMGIIVKRVIEGDPRSQYQLKGFIDDDRKMQGKKVDGYPVYSRKILTKEFIETEDIKVFIIAINNIAPVKEKRSY